MQKPEIQHVWLLGKCKWNCTKLTNSLSKGKNNGLKPYWCSYPTNVYLAMFYINSFFKLDWYLFSLYHHYSVISGLGGPMIKVVELQHNSDEELIKQTEAIFLIRLELGKLLMHCPVTIHTVYFLVCFPAWFWFLSATNFSDSAQALLRESRKEENLLQPSLFAGKENLGFVYTLHPFAGSILEGSGCETLWNGISKHQNSGRKQVTKSVKTIVSLDRTPITPPP